MEYTPTEFHIKNLKEAYKDTLCDKCVVYMLYNMYYSYPKYISKRQKLNPEIILFNDHIICVDQKIDAACATCGYEPENIIFIHEKHYYLLKHTTITKLKHSPYQFKWSEHLCCKLLKIPELGNILYLDKHEYSNCIMYFESTVTTINDFVHQLTDGLRFTIFVNRHTCVVVDEHGRNVPHKLLRDVKTSVYYSKIEGGLCYCTDSFILEINKHDNFKVHFKSIVGGKTKVALRE